MNIIVKNKLNPTKTSNNVAKSEERSILARSEENLKLEKDDTTLVNPSFESKKQLQQRQFLYKAPSHLYEF